MHGSEWFIIKYKMHVCNGMLWKQAMAAACTRDVQQHLRTCTPAGAAPTTPPEAMRRGDAPGDAREASRQAGRPIDPNTMRARTHAHECVLVVNLVSSPRPGLEGLELEVGRDIDVGPGGIMGLPR